MPQGSVNGPKFFNLFINDMFYLFIYTSVCNLADDTTPRVLVLEEHGFDVTQFAYLNNRSGSQAAVVLTEKISSALNENKKCGAVFFDFTDAFGSVDRVKLLSKLFYDFDINGKLFLHLTDFLIDRKARLKVGKLMGEWIETNIG